MFFTLKPKILYDRGGRPGVKNGKNGIISDREAAIQAEAKRLEELKKRDPKGRERKSLEGRMLAGTTVSGQDNEVYKKANDQGTGAEETGPSGSGNYDEAELNAYLQSVNTYRIGNSLDEHAKGIENIDKRLVVKSLAEFHGIEQSLGAAANRATGKDRKALDALLMKYATPKDMLGIGGMPPVFLDNTDPNGYKDKSVVGHHYFVNNVLYGTFIAFKPGFIRWDITNKQSEEIQGGGASPGFFSRAWAGTLAYNRPYVDGYYRDVSRTMRMVAFMMGLADVAFPFSLSYTQQAKQGVDNTVNGNSSRGWKSAGNPIGNLINKAKSSSKNLGNQGGYVPKKGSYLLATAGSNPESVMTGETYRALGQALASIIVNKQATPIGETEVGDAGFVAFRVDGNIEPSESLSNSSAGNPVKELAESVLGDTDDMIGHVIGRIFGDGSQDSLGALAFITGKPMLPNIWRESSFSKSYSVNFVFSSAYGNKLSLLLQVMYPTVKLFHLAAPTGIGGFMTSPPICRVFSAGTINTEYGMISSMSIQRDMKTLSDDGIPTSLSVNITVEDLNPFLYKEKPGWFNKSVELSTGLTIFMATLVGQNISTISRTARAKWNEVMLNVEANVSASDIANRINYGIADFVGGAFTPIYDWADSVKTKWVKLKGAANGLANLATNNNPENPNSQANQKQKGGVTKTSGNRFKGNK